LNPPLANRINFRIYDDRAGRNRWRDFLPSLCLVTSNGVMQREVFHHGVNFTKVRE
jgi:hypothetical protein